jgi:AGCS family alanine or glycine:cation symporter
VLCWAHYGEVGVNYFSRRAGVRRAYKLIYSLCVFLGALVSTDVLWESADLSIGTMSAINICALLLMSGRVKRETEEYFGRS